MLGPVVGQQALHADASGVTNTQSPAELYPVKRRPAPKPRKVLEVGSMAIDRHPILDKTSGTLMSVAQIIGSHCGRASHFQGRESSSGSYRLGQPGSNRGRGGECPSFWCFVRFGERGLLWWSRCR